MSNVKVYPPSAAPEATRAQMPNQILMSNDKEDDLSHFWIWDFDIHLTFGFWHLALIHHNFAKLHFFGPSFDYSDIPLVHQSSAPGGCSSGSSTMAGMALRNEWRKV
jgi:hypothetical protein